MIEGVGMKKTMVQCPFCGYICPIDEGTIYEKVEATLKQKVKDLGEGKFEYGDLELIRIEEVYTDFDCCGEYRKGTITEFIVKEEEPMDKNVKLNGYLEEVVVEEKGKEYKVYYEWVEWKESNIKTFKIVGAIFGVSWLVVHMAGRWQVQFCASNHHIGNVYHYVPLKQNEFLTAEEFKKGLAEVLAKCLVKYGYVVER